MTIKTSLLRENLQTTGIGKVIYTPLSNLVSEKE